MSLAIITGQAGSGKTRHAIERCRQVLAADESVCFITPISTRGHFGHDPELKALFELAQIAPKLRLQTPIPIDEIDLKRTKHVVLDEVALNPAGKLMFLGPCNGEQSPIEFSGLDFFKFAKRGIKKGCTLTLITQELTDQFFGALDIHSDEVPFTVVNVKYHGQRRQQSKQQAA